MGKCEESLALFPTTLEHDKELLARDDLTVNMRNAVLSRSGEKEIVDFYLRMAAEALAKITLGQAEVAKARHTMDEDPENEEVKRHFKQTRNNFARSMLTFPKDFFQENRIIDSHIP